MSSKDLKYTWLGGILLFCYWDKTSLLGKAIKDRAYWEFTVTVGDTITTMVCSTEHTGRHGAGAVAKRLHIDPQHKTES